MTLISLNGVVFNLTQVAYVLDTGSEGDPVLKVYFSSDRFVYIPDCTSAEFFDVLHPMGDSWVQDTTSMFREKNPDA